jgi:hypothetical protein
MEKNPQDGKKSESGIRDKRSGSYFRELSNNFWVKNIKFFVNLVLQNRIRNPGWKNPDTGLNPGSATLPPTFFSFSGRLCGY